MFSPPYGPAYTNLNANTLFSVISMQSHPRKASTPPNTCGVGTHIPLTTEEVGLGQWHSQFIYLAVLPIFYALNVDSGQGWNMNFCPGPLLLQWDCWVLPDVWCTSLPWPSSWLADDSLGWSNAAETAKMSKNVRMLTEKTPLVSFPTQQTGARCLNLR